MYFHSQFLHTWITLNQKLRCLISANAVVFWGWTGVRFRFWFVIPLSPILYVTFRMRYQLHVIKILMDIYLFLMQIIWVIPHGENFIAIFTTPSVVIWFSTGTLGIFATLLYVFTVRVVIYDILSMAIITTLSTSTLFCNLYYILLWISPRSMVKIAIRM